MWKANKIFLLHIKVGREYLLEKSTWVFVYGHIKLTISLLRGVFIRV